MILNEWEIWHTYTTYLQVDMPDLFVAAQRLVKYEISNSVLIDDGTCVWKQGLLVSHGKIKMSTTPDWRRGDIEFPSGMDGYALEGVYQGSAMLWSEKRVFGEDLCLPLPYLRALLGECTLITQSDALTFYPMLKLYSSGIVSVSLRMIHPPNPLPLHRFINNYANAFLISFDQALIPHGVYRNSVLYDYALNASFPRGRIQSGSFKRNLDLLIREEVREYKTGDFVFHNVEVDGFVTLSRLALRILESVAFAVNGQREGLALSILGRKSKANLGGRWVGRRHIHLIRFSEQALTISEVENLHRGALGAIFAGYLDNNTQATESFLPQNLRQRQDYGVYIRDNGTLYVHASQSIQENDSVPWGDPNRGHLIYEHQVINEMLDLGYALHRRMAEQASHRKIGSTEALRYQSDILDYERVMSEIGRFGEIRDLLRKGWESFDVENWRTLATKSLSLRHTEATLRWSQRTQRVSAYLAFVAGLLSIPQLASAVIKPLWTWKMWWPTGRDYSEIMYVGISIALVVPLLLVGYWLVNRKD